MHATHDMKTLSVNDFATHAELAGQTLVGWIRYDATAPDVIYFSVSPTICPHHPIPKISIETLQLFGGESIPCPIGGSGEPVGVMFHAKIVLKQDAPGGGLARLVVSLANAAKNTGELSLVAEQSRPLITVLKTGYYICVFPLQGGHFYYVGPYNTYQAADAARSDYQPPYANANSPIYLRAGQNFPGT